MTAGKWAPNRQFLKRSGFLAATLGSQISSASVFKKDVFGAILAMCLRILEFMMYDFHLFENGLHTSESRGVWSVVGSYADGFLSSMTFGKKQFGLRRVYNLLAL